MVSEAHVGGATASTATLEAMVNPEGFATTYRFEYGLTNAYGQSTETIALKADRDEHPAQAVLEGLSPARTYYWRILAVNSSGQDESTGTVRTYPIFAPHGGCANEALRQGDSASLPDCRAYEMVSPVDKNGGDIVAGLSTPADPGGYIQSSPAAERITYTSATSFAGEPASFRFNQYLAERRERGAPGEGWETEGTHPPVEGEVNSLSPGFNREFIAFSADLCSAWLIDYQDPPPSPDGQVGFRNLFRRQSCEPGAGSLEALVPSPPALPEGTEEQYVRNSSVEGISGDGRHAVFTAGASLPQAQGAAPGSNNQVYDRFAGKLSLVSVLPDGSTGDPAPADGKGFANPGASAVGSTFTNGNLQGAVSGDGSRVLWTAVAGSGVPGSGTIYLREHPEQGIVANECAGANACTYQVSGSESGTASAFFWAGGADASKVLYTEAGGIFESALFVEGLFTFDLGKAKEGKQARRLIAQHVDGVVGAGDDLRRVYFASHEAIPGTGGAAGKPNVYLYEEGPGGEASYRLVATVDEGDVGNPGAGESSAYNLSWRAPRLRAVRVSPDGASLAFNSRAQLTGYDNTDAATGKPAVEVYLYDARTGELRCASCNPSGARPRAETMLQPYALPQDLLPTSVVAAAWIPTWEHPNNASNVLSAGGGRLFFNAADRLVPRDANGAQDVYQWEAPGVGACTTASPSYFPQNGGCIDLISSGQSSYKSEFREATPSGDDVFFTTESSLVPRDPGLVDLYDARVNGGFPEPVAAAECEGEACQGPAAPPPFDTPPSATYTGPGNPAPASGCRRPARRAGALARRAKRNRRAARRAARAGARAAAAKKRRAARRLARAARRKSAAARRCRRRARAARRASR